MRGGRGSIILIWFYCGWTFQQNWWILLEILQIFSSRYYGLYCQRRQHVEDLLWRLALMYFTGMTLLNANWSRSGEETWDSWFEYFIVLIIPKFSGKMYISLFKSNNRWPTERNIKSGSMFSSYTLEFTFIQQ